MTRKTISPARLAVPFARTRLSSSSITRAIASQSSVWAGSPPCRPQGLLKGDFSSLLLASNPVANPSMTPGIPNVNSSPTQVGTDALGRPVNEWQIYDPTTTRDVPAGATDPVTPSSAACSATWPTSRRVPKRSGGSCWGSSRWWPWPCCWRGGRPRGKSCSPRRSYRCRLFVVRRSRIGRAACCPTAACRRTRSFNNVAYIDASHLEAYSSDLWASHGIAGLLRTLMRQGYVPLLAPELSANSSNGPDC